jgi:hypothetical protein
MRSSGRLHARSGLGSLSTSRASRRRNVKQGTSPSINAEMDKLRGSASDVVFLNPSAAVKAVEIGLTAASRAR